VSADSVIVIAAQDIAHDKPTYIHHVPGRLRVRTPHVRQHAELARFVESNLRLHPGVVDVAVSELTGSIRVLFRPDATSAETILAWLQEQGLVKDEAKVPAYGSHRNTSTSPDKNLADGAIAKKLATIALETAVEKSVVLLVASLL
jgi:hypothetical protein